MASSKRNKLVWAALATTVLASGCSNYMNSWDTVSIRSGNAAEANSAIQVIQPWPPEAYNTDIYRGG